MLIEDIFPTTKERKEILLEDDDNPLVGGLAFEGESLQDFMESVGLEPDSRVNTLQRQLRECGIKELEEIDRKVNELVQQKIWDIQEELDVYIDSYTWDYKY